LIVQKELQKGHFILGISLREPIVKISRSFHSLDFDTFAIYSENKDTTT